IRDFHVTGVQTCALPISRFVDLPARLRNVDALQEEIEKVFVGQPTAHWWERLDRAGVPGGPVYTYEECLNDPHVRAREMIREIRSEERRVGEEWRARR